MHLLLECPVEVTAELIRIRLHERKDGRLQRKSSLFQPPEQAYRLCHPSLQCISLVKGLRAMNLSEYSGTKVKFLVEWLEVLRRMNKMSDKDERYPFVHVITQLMEVLRSDPKLSDAFTTLKHKNDETKALQEMKDRMMDKAALYDGSEENATNTSTSRTISALAHQVGIDNDDIYTLLVNKGKLDPTTRMPNNLFTTWSRDSPKKMVWEK